MRSCFTAGYCHCCSLIFIFSTLRNVNTARKQQRHSSQPEDTRVKQRFRYHQFLKDFPKGVGWRFKNFVEELPLFFTSSTMMVRLLFQSLIFWNEQDEVVPELISNFIFEFFGQILEHSNLFQQITFLIYLIYWLRRIVTYDLCILFTRTKIILPSVFRARMSVIRLGSVRIRGGLLLVQLGNN